MTKLIAFPWCGGKFTHLDFILPYLPNDAEHYVEVFGGSAAVLLNRDPAPIETYNDIDGDAVNFFRVLRDRTDDLVRAVSLTLYSREEFGIACMKESGVDDLERARRFYVRARQSFGAVVQLPTTDGYWGYSVARCAGKLMSWLKAPDMLCHIATRLKLLQIENRPYGRVIDAFDSPTTLFYLDPPYVPATRNFKKTYAFEMDDGGHVDLAKRLNGIKGRAVVSGYRCDLYDNLYSGWNRVDSCDRCLRVGRAKELRQESIWMNFEPAASHQAKQLTMFA